MWKWKLRTNIMQVILYKTNYKKIINLTMILVLEKIRKMEQQLQDVISFLGNRIKQTYLITNLLLCFSTCCRCILYAQIYFYVHHYLLYSLWTDFINSSHCTKLYMRTKEKYREKLKNCAKQFKEKLRTQQRK